MTRSAALLRFFLRSVIPIAAAGLLYFSFCLYEGRTNRLCVALDSLRNPIWHTQNSTLDHSPRWVIGRIGGPICRQFYPWRSHWRFHPYMASDRCSLLHSIDSVSVNYRIMALAVIFAVSQR